MKKIPTYFRIGRTIYKVLWKINKTNRYLCYSNCRYKKYSEKCSVNICKNCLYKKVCILRPSHLTCIDLDNATVFPSDAIEFYLKRRYKNEM